jgi:hypothetical protein
MIDQVDFLLGKAQPDLYRANAFRITELPVDASDREAARQLDKIRILEKMGEAARPGGGLMPLKPAPGADRLREAMERLRDPEARLVDEFFWFWPRQWGESKTDPALAALARGDFMTASKAWVALTQEGDPDRVGKHNLAVLNHVLALDLEHGMAEHGVRLDEEKSTYLHRYWTAALDGWRELLEDEDFWDHLLERIHELDQPQLTAETAGRMQQGLAVTLLSINARLALRAAEQDRLDDARRLARLIERSGFPRDDIEEALRRGIEPLRDRIQHLCEAAEAEGEADPEHGDRVIRRLLDDTALLLQTLDCLLPRSHAALEAAHDQVALQVRSCLVTYANKTDNWEKALELTDLALEVAVGESARDRLREDRAKVQENLQFSEQVREFGTCWFCRKSSAEDGVAAQVEMHGNVQRYGNTVTWTKLTLEVPRCRPCRSAHRKSLAATVLGFLAGGLLGFPGCQMVNAAGDAVMAGLMLLGFLVGLGGLIGWAIGRAFLPEGVQPEGHKYQFSSVQRRVAEGWAYGGKPAGVN